MLQYVLDSLYLDIAACIVVALDSWIIVVNLIVYIVQKLPSPFLNKCGDHVPRDVIFQLPNGYQYYCRFNKQGRKFENVGLFYSDFETDEGFHCLVCYRGSGIFTLFILDCNGMEIAYPAAKKLLLAPVFLEGM